MYSDLVAVPSHEHTHGRSDDEVRNKIGKLEQSRLRKVQLKDLQDCLGSHSVGRSSDTELQVPTMRVEDIEQSVGETKAQPDRHIQFGFGRDESS